MIMWIFEDYLKKVFWKFVQLLKVLSDDPVVHIRHRVLGFIAELVATKPEQEQTLLELLINKMVRIHGWIFRELLACSCYTSVIDWTNSVRWIMGTT